jgi:VCBS repeat protein
MFTKRLRLLHVTIAVLAPIVVGVPGPPVAAAPGIEPSTRPAVPGGDQGEWPLARGDVVNSGHQGMAGRISRPGLAASAYLGGSTGFVLSADLDEAPGRELLFLTAGRLVATTADLTERWTVKGPGDVVGVHDLDGDGTKEVVAIGGRSVFVLAGETGSTLWQHDFGSSVSADYLKVADLDSQRSGLELVVWPTFSDHGIAYSFSAGATTPEMIWQTTPAYEHAPYFPEVAVGDMDADGENEVVIAGYGGMRSFDGATGVARTAETGWNGRVDWIAGPGIDGRNYGQLQLIDIDDDPQLEIVMIADGVTLHIGVVQNDASELSLLYDKFIDYPENLKTLRNTQRSVGDLDGDGRVEMAVNLYNDTGDNRWHLLVVDVLTGFAAPELDLADVYMHGVRDLDGDGTSELLVSKESARVPASSSPLEVYTVGPGGMYERSWSGESGRYVIDPHLLPPATLSPHTRNAMREVLDASPLGDFVVVTGDQARGFGYDGVTASQVWERTLAGGTIHRIEDLDGNGEAEVVVQGADGRLLVERPDGTLLGQRPLGAFVGPPTVADLRGDGTNEVLVAFGGSVRVFDSRKGKLTERWRVPGHGVMVYLGGEAVPAVDLDGDGDKEVVIGDADGAHSRLRVLNASGEEVWSHVFDDLPAPTPGNGVYTWTFGNFTGDDVLDIYVAAFSGGYNTEVSRMLDGRTGELVASRNDNPERPGIGFGPWVGHTAVKDLDGDGLDEAVFLAKDVTYAINGTDMVHPRIITGHQGLYHTPAFVDVNADGRDEMVMGAGFNFLDVVTFAAGSTGSALWTHAEPAQGELLGRQSGVADVDGDGQVELATYDASGTVTSFNAATGAEEWQYTLPSPGANITTVDVNGDGRVDYVLGTAAGQVVALDGRADAAERVLWTLEVGYGIGDIAAADVDRDGKSELVFGAGDGRLHVVDQARNRP